MSQDLHDYEKVSIYQLDPEVQEQLLSEVREATFNWCTKDEHPMGVIHAMLWAKGRVWMTAGAHRHRISAVRRNPKVSVVVSSAGTSLGAGKAVTVKGRCIIHEEREIKDWFYPAFSKHLNPEDDKAADAFCEMLDSPLRVVLEIVPEKYITYDGEKMWGHTAGTVDESTLAEPLEADTVRLERELKRRGLK